MKRLVNGYQHKLGKDASFVILHGDTPPMGKAYGELEGRVLPFVLMQYRWDGCLGFPGGKIEKDETLKDNALREMFEEIGYIANPDKLEFLCSHVINDVMHTHAYTYEISFEEAKNIIKSAPNAEYFGEETGGSVILILEDFGKGTGIENILNSALASTVKEELAVLCLKLQTSGRVKNIVKKIFTEEQLLEPTSYVTYDTVSYAKS